jgi:hypothetical protein
MGFVGKILKGTLGFIFGAAVTLAVGIALLIAISWIFDMRLQPRGLGWFISPIAVGVMGWRVGYNFDLRNASWAIRNPSRQLRTFVACLALWTVAVVVIFLVFDPFDRYRWRVEEWTKFLTILWGPAVLWIVGQYLFAWARKGDELGTEHKDT